MSRLEQALTELYSVPPPQFLATRARLVEQLRDIGEDGAARNLAARRKPTIAAWVVNSFVVAGDGDVVERLTELGDELRAAQDALDAERLRELATRRRALVSELCRDALSLAGRGDGPSALADEVRATFDAALADRDVAARLGRLQRAQAWSGFGFDVPDGPRLSVVRAARTRDARTRPSAAERREAHRALDEAEQGLAAAEADLVELDERERATRAAIARAERAMQRARRDLDGARAELEELRTLVRAGNERRRAARRALDRAQAADRPEG